MSLLRCAMVSTITPSVVSCHDCSRREFSDPRKSALRPRIVSVSGAPRCSISSTVKLPLFNSADPSSHSVSNVPRGGYLSALNSAWLNESATLFRRKFYQNGAHAGYITYVTDAAQSSTDVESLRSAMRDSKGLGNFKNLYFYAPNGKPDGIKIVPLSEVATKDDFFNIKKVSAADLLDAHRVPFQLMGGKPENIGSMGDVEKVAKVFVYNELSPLQERFKEINDWLGLEVIRFKDYSLESE